MLFDIFFVIIGLAIMPFAITGFVMFVDLAITIIVAIILLILAIIKFIVEFIEDL
jgi:hypothetical protein